MPQFKPFVTQQEYLRCLRSRARTRRQRGASLLEAIAYLGIAAIVVIGAVALLNGAFSSASTNAVNEQVSAIQTGVKKLYMGQVSGYDGMTNASLIGTGVFPTTMPQASGGGVTDAWGADVVVAGKGGSFTITYGSVPKSVCINSIVAGGSWTSIKVNEAAAFTAMPVAPGPAQTACSTDANTIVWTSS